MVINIIIHTAAWIASFGLLAAIVAWHAQAEAAQEKLAAGWALNRRMMHVGG